MSLDILTVGVAGAAKALGEVLPALTGQAIVPPWIIDNQGMLQSAQGEGVLSDPTLNYQRDAQGRILPHSQSDCPAVTGDGHSEGGTIAQGKFIMHVRPSWQRHLEPSGQCRAAPWCIGLHMLGAHGHDDISSWLVHRRFGQ